MEFRAFIRPTYCGLFQERGNNQERWRLPFIEIQTEFSSVGISARRSAARSFPGLGCPFEFGRNLCGEICLASAPAGNDPPETRVYVYVAMSFLANQSRSDVDIIVHIKYTVIGEIALNGREAT